eukprot:2296006-Ditylum_brightwellii.AAC.1
MEIKNTYKENCELPSQGYEFKGFKNLVNEHGSEMKINRVMVCYHRAKIIPDCLIPSKLFKRKLVM